MEHVILIAFDVSADTSEDAERVLYKSLRHVTEDDNIDSWWVAEDGRHDGSDCDSAVFVHPGAQRAAVRLLHEHNLTAHHNMSQGLDVPGRFEAPETEEPAGVMFTPPTRRQRIAGTFYIWWDKIRIRLAKGTDVDWCDDEQRNTVWDAEVCTSCGAVWQP